MERQEFFRRLERLGCQPQQALERFMGNEGLFVSFLNRLPEHLGLEQIRQSLEREDEDAFYMGVHNVKGMAGNLGLTPLSDSAQAILVEVRTSHLKHRQKLTALTRELEADSRTVVELIRRYREEEEA